jgi:hypothetical protein
MDRLELRTRFASRIEKFRLEDFDMEVNLRGLSALDRARVIDKYRLLEKEQNGENVMEKMTTETQCFIVSRGLVTEGGERIYKDDEAGLLAGEIPCKALDAISKKILSISGMGGNDAEDKAKNSAPTPSDNSSYVLQ